MQTNLDDAALEGLLAWYRQSGTPFVPHDFRHEGKEVWRTLKALLWRIANTQSVAPHIVETLRFIHCPLTEDEYVFERNFHRLLWYARAARGAAMPKSSDLGRWVTTFQTLDGVPPRKLPPELRARFEAVPGWTWQGTPKHHRSRAR